MVHWFSSLPIARILVVASLLVAAHRPASADIVLYNVPSTRMQVTLQGSHSVNPGRTVTFRHPRFGSLIFGLQDAEIFKVPTTRSLAEARLGKAKRTKSVDAVLKAGSWVLHHGLLDEFYDAAKIAWAIDRNHPRISSAPTTAPQEDASCSTCDCPE